MNVEKLYVVLKSATDDIAKTKILEHLQNIINMLTNLANSPNPSYQQNLTGSLNALREVSEKSRFDNFPPSFRQVISDVNPRMLLGKSLFSVVSSILERNQITYQLAANEITPLLNEVSQFNSNATAFVTASSNLGLKGTDLGAGECEIGFLVPRREIANDFHTYRDELGNLELILNTFTEYTSGTKQPLELRSLSSSDPMIYVGVLAGAAAAIAKAIDWIIDSYKKILEIRLLHAQLRQAGVPEENVKGIESYSNDLMKNEVSKILKLLEEEYCGVKDKARKNELESALGICLNQIANRIDAGYSFEVRVGPLPKPKDNEEPEARAKLEANIEEIRRVEANITFMNLEGSRLLSLSESPAKGSR